MLRTVLAGTVVIAAAAVQVAGPQPAWAGGPGGGGVGGVQCGQSYTPSCLVSARSPGSPRKPGATAGPAASGAPDRSSGGSGCVRSLGTTGCPLPSPGGSTGGGPLTPGTLAQAAARRLLLPGPAIRSSPPPGVPQLVHLPVWLWVNPAVWSPRSQTAAVPGERVTATAIPAAVTWRMGDGAVVTCPGPGTPYSAMFPPASASLDCGHTYQRPSAGQPGGVYRVTATITWDITWTGTGRAGGMLPPLFTTATAGFRVEDSQAVNISSGGHA